MDLGLDYSFARPGGAAIKAAGYKFVCRYYGSAANKRLTAAEVADLVQNDLSIATVFEDAANQALSGYNQGVADAQKALAQANDAGQPADRPIYFAVDFDINDAQKVTAGEYMKGVISVLGLSRVGAYGGYYWIKYCVDNGLATFFWQTLAWSGGQVHPATHIYQNGQSAFGGGADIDEARKSDFGQWGGIIDGMTLTQDEAAQLALYIRLLSFESVDEANSHSADDVQHMLADPAYAGAIAKAVYSGEWQTPAWKAAHYDELATQNAELQKQLDAKPPTTPAPDPSTPTPDPAPSKLPGWLQKLIDFLSGK